MFLFLQILATLACVLAFIFQLAVHRSPDISDSNVTTAGRKVTVVALAVAALYLSYYTVAHGAIQAPVVLVIGLFALGQLLFALNNLNYMKALWDSHLHSSH